MKLTPEHMEMIRALEDRYGCLNDVPSSNKQLKTLRASYYEPRLDGRPLPIKGVDRMRIKKAMFTRGITQSYLANHIEISRSALHNRLEGKYAFMVEELLRISRVLRLDLPTITDQESYGIVKDYLLNGMDEGEDNQ